MEYVLHKRVSLQTNQQDAEGKKMSRRTDTKTSSKSSPWVNNRRILKPRRAYEPCYVPVKKASS